MKDLSIKVNIAGRMYPLTVQQTEEENIRKAVKAIDEMVRDYEQNYAVKDKQDLLAMVALQYATQSIELNAKTTSIDSGLNSQLKVLNDLISEVL
ncbi:MAG: cell division protein ZapA [Vicingaceae bacterium]